MKGNMNANVISLSDAQMSALECCGLFECDDLNADEQVLRQAVEGRRLVVTDGNRDAIFRALTDWSNAEDEVAQDRSNEMAIFAGRASRALATVASKVLRSA